MIKIMDMPRQRDEACDHTTGQYAGVSGRVIVGQPDHGQPNSRQQTEPSNHPAQNTGSVACSLPILSVNEECESNAGQSDK